MGDRLTESTILGTEYYIIDKCVILPNSDIYIGLKEISVCDCVTFLKASRKNRRKVLGFFLFKASKDPYIISVHDWNIMMIDSSSGKKKKIRKD